MEGWVRRGVAARVRSPAQTKQRIWPGSQPPDTGDFKKSKKFSLRQETNPPGAS